MDQYDYFSILRAAIDLRGKHVLEVGGAVPVALVERAQVGSWTALDISNRRLGEAGAGQSGQTGKYRTINLDIAALEEADQYDLVYSTNCFEHIGNLRVALERMYAALKEGGVLFTLFAPIWTSPVGHHAFVHWKGGVLTFEDGVLPPWYHLLREEAEMHSYLERRFDAKVADDLCRCTYRGGDINRLLDADYEAMIAKYPYKSLLRYRMRSRLHLEKGMLAQLQRRCPGGRDFSTLGYFWVLKKGTPRIGEVARLYTRGFGEMLRRKYGKGALRVTG